MDKLVSGTRKDNPRYTLALADLVETLQNARDESERLIRVSVDHSKKKWDNDQLIASQERQIDLLDPTDEEPNRYTYSPCPPPFPRMGRRHCGAY
jgi:hypothetical protein